MIEQESLIFQNILLLLSIVLSVAAFLYSYYTNTKKYELTNQYRTEILSWYKETITVMKELLAEQDKKDVNRFEHLLAKLSTQIDLGRFYFPNSERGDDKGADQPSAFRGYRNVILDTLVFYYTLLMDKGVAEHDDRLKELQRIFTSQVFDQIDPREFLRETKRHTNKSFYSPQRLEDTNIPTLIEIDAFIRSRS